MCKQAQGCNNDSNEVIFYAAVTFSKQNFLFRHQIFKKNSRLFKVSSVNTNLDDDVDFDNKDDENYEKDDAVDAIL